MEFRQLVPLFSFLVSLLPSVTQPQLSSPRATSPLEVGKQMYGAAVAGDYLYIIGGNDHSDAYVSDVIKAQINDDGSLGAWTPTSPLPQPRAYINNSTVVEEDRIYVFSGYNGNTDEKLRTIAWTRQLEGGELEQWRESSLCPAPGVANAAAVSTGAYLHLIGGSVGDSIPSPSVWSVQTASDGTPGGWEVGPPLPFALWFHSGARHEDKVYVWGGLTSPAATPVNPVCFMSDVNEDGTLSEWKIASALLNPGFYSASSTVLGGYLYSFSPRYEDSVQSGDVWYGLLNGNGGIQWNKREINFPVKMYHGIAADTKRSTIYIPGGRPDKNSKSFDRNIYYMKTNSSFSDTEMTYTPAVAPPATAQKTPEYANVDPATGILLFDQKEEPALQTSQISQTPSAMDGWKPSLKGFVDPAGAQELAGHFRLPRIVFIHDGEGNSAQKQAAQLSSFSPDEYFGKIVFEEATTRHHPQEAQRLGAATTPVWVFLDSGSVERGRKTGIISSGDLHEAVQAITQ